MRSMELIGAAILLGTSGTAMAQDAGGETDVENVEEASNGAVVTREEITEQVLDENGEPVPAVDANGEPIIDANGNPVFETQVVGFTQTVVTPSGITHTVTKVDGSPAVVTHQNLGRPDVAAAASAAAEGRARGEAARSAASHAAATARSTAESARQNASAARNAAQTAREQAQQARDSARNARDNARGGRPGG